MTRPEVVHLSDVGRVLFRFQVVAEVFQVRKEVSHINRDARFHREISDVDI